MKLVNLLITVLFVLGAAPANAAKAVMEFEDEAIPALADGSTRSIDDVRSSIMAGCEAKGWTAEADGDAQVKCSILVRQKHYAEVIIPFSATAFSVKYSDSRQLDYNEKKHKIHRNYNNWVVNLVAAINQQF